MNCRKRARVWSVIGALAASAQLALLSSSPAAAATEYRVNTLLDPDNTQGMCATSGSCSLRQAINAANASVGADTIVFDVTGVHPVGGASSVVNAQLPIVMDPVTITGNGGGTTGTRIDGGDSKGVFSIFSSGVTFNDLRVQNGRLTNIDFGAGIFLGSGALTLNRVTVTENEIVGATVGGGGAGIATQAATSLTLNESTVSSNTLAGANFGAGITVDASAGAGTLDLNRSTVSGNIASAGGGGIFFRGNGIQTIRNSTISDNQGGDEGGGIDTVESGTLTVTNATIAGNSATVGAGIRNVSEATTLKNTILDNVGDNCNLFSGSISSATPGNNIDSGTTCGFGMANGNLSSTAPLLFGLADNGGPTQTRALMAGSPALNAATADCGGAPVAGVDQRGIARPQGPACEIGAYEAVPPATGGGAGTPPVTATGQRAAALKKCTRKKGKARKKCKKKANKLPV